MISDFNTRLSDLLISNQIDPGFRIYKLSTINPKICQLPTAFALRALLSPSSLSSVRSRFALLLCSLLSPPGSALLSAFCSLLLLYASCSLLLCFLLSSSAFCSLPPATHALPPAYCFLPVPFQANPPVALSFVADGKEL